MDWMEHLKQLLQLIFSKKVSGAALILCSLLLATPDSLAQPLHIANLRQQHADRIGLALLACLSILAIHGLASLRHHAKLLLHARKQIRTQQRQLALKQAAIEKQNRILHTLTAEQQKLISEFTADTSLHAYLPAYHPVTAELEDSGIIIPQGSVFYSSGHHRSYMLSETARKHLYGQRKC